MNQQAKTTLRTLGERLEQTRKQQGLSINEVAEQLRLPIQTIQALEYGVPSGMPLVYFKGHCRRYLDYLARFDRTLKDLSPELCPALATPQYQGQKLPTALPVAHRRRFFEHGLRVASYLIVTAGVVVPLVWWFTEGAVRMSFDEALVRKQPIDISRDIQQSAAEENSRLEPHRSIRPQHLQASAAPIAALRNNAEMAVPGEQGLAADILSTLTATAGAWEGIPYRLGPAPPLYGSDQPVEHVLSLRLLNESWVEITGADGTRHEFDLLKAGEQRDYTVQVPLKILVGKASAVDMVLDGQHLDLSPYTRGNVARIQLDEAFINSHESLSLDTPR